MINPELLSTGFEDIICEATEELSGPEIYAAFNKAINRQMDWHKKELKALQDLQWLMTGAVLKDPSDQP